MIEHTPVQCIIPVLTIVHAKGKTTQHLGEKIIRVTEAAAHGVFTGICGGARNRYYRP